MIIPCRNYSEEEKATLEAVMTASHPILQKLADKKFRTIRELRKDYFGKSLVLNDQAEKNAFDNIRLIETQLMECYGKLIFNIAKHYYLREKTNKPDVEIDDYIQEGMMALIDAAYYYDGSQRFTTFATFVVRNKLREYIRNNCSLSRIKKRILKLRTQLHKLMNTKNLSFDAAAEELKLSKKDKDEVMQSLIKAVSDVKWDFMYSSVNYSENDQLVMKAFEEAELSDFERDVLQAKIDHVSISSVTEKYHYSRMAGSLALKRACKIVKEKYEELSRAA
jgi:RNA polymerase sigma factor (sigma-70 family)